MRNRIHAPYEIYMDKCFFNSLKLRFEFKKEKCGKHFYQPKMQKAPATYFFASFDEIMRNLQT
jgi:hypothetical protein